MKNIDSFLSRRLYEYRTPGSKNMPKDMDKIEGKPADTNGTHGAVGFNEPEDNSAKVKIDSEEMNKNMKRLLMKFKTREPFFIIGRAGWGKTSIIKDLADKFGFEVITFYLDKCEATDLGGIPVAAEENGVARHKVLLPEWASPIFDNPDKKYLLFFDEMNQAAPDVMNALMPIVLENEIAGKKPKTKDGKDANNFFVGAAGNFESENGAVNELSGPLKSRFKPLIVWETGTEETWKAAFSHLHKVWDDKLGKDFVKTFEDNASLFDNPREIDQKVLKFVYELKKDGDFDSFDSSDFLDRLEGLAKEDLSRAEKDQLAQLAEETYSFLHKKQGEGEKTSGRSSRKDMNMIDENVKAAIKQAMKYGYICQKEHGKDLKYGISRENIGTLVEEEDCNAEMLERIINKFEADGIKFKYEKDEEWRKAGLKDPEKDYDENGNEIK